MESNPFADSIREGERKMIVTKIEQQKQHAERYSVFIDGEFSFALIKEDILYFKLEEGKEISEEEVNFIQDSLIYIKAQDAAVYYVGYKGRTEQEVRRKLKQKNFSEETVERVVEFLKKYHYVDDKKFCEAYIRESMNQKPKGKAYLKMKLIEKGIETTVIEEALEESGMEEIEGAKKLLKKKLKNFQYVDEKTKLKAFASLQRKGYPYSVIKEAYQSCIEEEEVQQTE